ncbi:GNAT family N-acetyltransferase [Actinorhabdospora filicis]|uniref:GNAT family N-acetyltransferase n=1 Tax=Actinorhabdospora filicis TaxID=1785913 RepID=A0A9W6W7Y9_9ACTN|nr:GNAT family N-acetyltransferase [Actinorhabdospora filicis]GLZ77044.1 GNAT family N-acetyltransferase [Actinorhabdospora filicis]
MIRRLDFTGPDMAAYAAVRAAADANDRPDRPPIPAERLAALLAHPQPGKTTEYWGWFEGEELAGAALLFLPGEDNTHTVELEGQVAPAFRRRGIGRALFELTRERAQALGRTLILVNVLAPAPGSPLVRDRAGEAFCAAMDMEVALVDIRSELTVGPVDEPVDDGRLVRWVDGVPGDPPAEWLPELARLMTRLDADAPAGDLDVTPEVWTPERLLEAAAVSRETGTTAVHTALRDGDRLIGWSTIELTGGTHAEQGITVVLPEHRGAGLGLLLKRANLSFARRIWPALATVTTFNAETNAAMLAVNRRMGYVDLDRMVHFQAKVGQAKV